MKLYFDKFFLLLFCHMFSSPFNRTKGGPVAWVCFDNEEHYACISNVIHSHGVDNQWKEKKGKCSTFVTIFIHCYQRGWCCLFCWVCFHDSFQSLYLQFLNLFFLSSNKKMNPEVNLFLQKQNQRKETRRREELPAVMRRGWKSNCFEEELFQESLLFLSFDVLPSKNYLRSNESIETETAVASSTASWCFLTSSPLISFPSVVLIMNQPDVVFLPHMSSPFLLKFLIFRKRCSRLKLHDSKEMRGEKNWRRDVSEDECPHKSFLVSHSHVNLIAHLHESP